MSYRYNNAFVKPGLNTLVAPTPNYGYYLFGWGRNDSGQLGLNNTTWYSSPKQVGSLTNWLKIACAQYSTIAIKTDGTLWSWGANSSGQLGLGNKTVYSSPKQVGALTNWKNISIYANSGTFVLATKTDGTLWSWGNNTYGELGLGNTTDYSSPKQVGALTTWLYVSCGNNYSAAVKTDGTLWVWGGGSSVGNLGLNNASVSYSSPKQVGSLTNWASVNLGQGASKAIKTDGTLWSWGWNNTGQLGLGNKTNYSSPKQVGALTNWLQAASGQYATFAVKTDGTLWAWGDNGFGTLGTGNTTNYSSPKQVGSLSNWSSISAGQYSAAAKKSDSTIWTWGAGGAGQLGQGNTTYYSSPKQVGALTTWNYIFTDGRNTFATQL